MIKVEVVDNEVVMTLDEEGVGLIGWALLGQLNEFCVPGSDKKIRAIRRALERASEKAFPETPL